MVSVKVEDGIYLFLLCDVIDIYDKWLDVSFLLCPLYVLQSEHCVQTEDLGGGMPCCKTVFFKLEDLCCFRCFLWSCNYFFTSIEPDCPFVSAVQQRRQKMAWTLVSR